MPNPTEIVTEFVLEQLSDAPLKRRIQVTRALGELHTGQLRADLLSAANLLEDIEHNHRQLTLRFKGGRRA